MYEYEPEGVGSETARCGAGAGSGSEVYAPGREYEAAGEKGVAGAGCVALISSGSSGEESAFMEASESGGDVFFITSARLVAGSVEGGTSLYDAHECTVLSPCIQETEAPPECDTAEGCRGAPEGQPSIFGAPASATLQGNRVPTSVPPPTSTSAPKKVTKTPKCKRGQILNSTRTSCIKHPKPKRKKKTHAKKRTR